MEMELTAADHNSRMKQHSVLDYNSHRVRSPFMSCVRRIHSTSGVHVRESMSTRSAGVNMLLTCFIDMNVKTAIHQPVCSQTKRIA